MSAAEATFAAAVRPATTPACRSRRALGPVSGFSLIELLVALSVVAIMAAAAAPGLSGSRRDLRSRRRLQPARPRSSPRARRGHRPAGAGQPLCAPRRRDELRGGLDARLARVRGERRRDGRTDRRGRGSALDPPCRRRWGRSPSGLAPWSARPRWPPPRRASASTLADAPTGPSARSRSATRARRVPRRSRSSSTGRVGSAARERECHLRRHRARRDG